MADTAPIIRDKEDFAKACAAFATVSRETLAKLERYAALLLKWQPTLNLIAGGTADDIWQRHMFDSAQLMRFIPADKNAVIVDLGSGGGFPGLVIAILLHSGVVHLVESDHRKAGFLATVAGDLGLKTKLHIKRIEAVEPFGADFVTARALAPLPQLLDWAAPFMRLGAKGLFLKGESVLSELTDAAKSGMLGTYQTYPSLSSSKGSVIEIHHEASADDDRLPSSGHEPDQPPAIKNR